MSLSESEARIKSRIWQALAQSEIEFGGLENESIQQLVDLVTEAALLEVDKTLDTSLAGEDVQAAVAQNILEDDKEDVLWEGRPFLSLTTHYRITDERVRITEGLLGKDRENVELVRVQDLDYSQTFGERLLSIGDITIRSHDPSHPIIILRNVEDPEGLYEVLRRAVYAARRKHGLTYQEEM